jgi:1A family penicillin-binding protein
MATSRKISSPASLLNRALLGKAAARPRRFWKKRAWWQKFILGIIFLVGMITIGFLAWFLRDLPSPTRLKSADALSVSTQIFDRNGTLLYEVFADENRTPIKLSDLPEYVPQATISIEDQNFYHHFGLDFVGITRALINTFVKQRLQGGSTLTQQLVKVSLLSNERTWERKAKEAVLTLATEVMYSKDEILEMYLNHIPYGGTAWGIEAAATTFFDKSAKDLTLAEAAYLAGLPQSPTRYSPFGNTKELGDARQKEVLRRMAEDGYITEEQAEQAGNETLVFAQKRFNIQAPHFVFYVRDQLTEQYGQRTVERGGLRVTTTLDLELQNAAQASVSAEVAKLARAKVSTGATIVTKPKTGEILAMVGSHDYFNATSEGQINMTTRLRQPGSSIKPLNLATALQLRRATLGTMLLDIPTCFQAIGQSEYCPRNYDNSFRGPVNMRQALANSYNIPAVKLLAMNSLENFIATASALGISSFTDPSRYGLSLSLGAGEVTMVDMATAYGSVANGGVKVPTISILKIEDYQGKVLYEAHPEKRAEQVESIQFLNPGTDASERPIPDLKISQDSNEIYRVLDTEVAFLVSDVMSDNQARAAAFGTNSQLAIKGQKVAAKTGTTNDLRDNWTVGFTPDYLTIAWVGNTDNSPMNQSLVSGVTGAAPIWNSVMSWILKSRPVTQWPEPPATIASASFCRRSGARPGSGTPSDRGCEMMSELFWKGTEPSAGENVVSETWIVGQTGLPPKPEDPTDQLRLEMHVLLTDPFTRNYCLDCGRATVEVAQPDGTLKQETVPERYFVSVERQFEINSGNLEWRE